jgi:hypothetical protein
MEFSTWRRASLPVFALMLSACAGYTKRVDLKELPTASDAYLFGRFYMNAPKSALAIDGHQTMGFAIECDDKQRYVVRFDRDQPLLAIKLRPSVCSWAEIVYTDVDGAVKTRKPAPRSDFKQVTIQPGKAYYLGDFGAESKVSVQGNQVHTEWVITAIADYFHRSSRDLVQAYPNLYGLSMVDIALLQSPLPKEDAQVAAMVVGEPEIRAEYDKYFAAQGDTEFHARHILVSSEDKVAAVKARLAQKQRFEVIAKDLSEDPGSRSSGGDLGWAVPAVYTPAFAQALRQLKPGERTPDAVRTEFGWHFIDVVETRPNVTPDFEDVHDRIAAVLRKRKAKDATAASSAASSALSAQPALKPQPAPAAAPQLAEGAAAAPATNTGKAKKTKKAKPVGKGADA